MSAETFPETFEDLLRLTRTAPRDGDLQVLDPPPAPPTPAPPARTWFGPASAHPASSEPISGTSASQWFAARRGTNLPPAQPAIIAPFAQAETLTATSVLTTIETIEPNGPDVDGPDVDGPDVHGPDVDGPDAADTAGSPPRSRADRRREDVGGDPPRRRAIMIGMIGGLTATVALAAVVTGALRAADQADLRAADPLRTHTAAVSNGHDQSSSGAGSGSGAARSSGDPSSASSATPASTGAGTGAATATGTGAQGSGRTVAASLYWLTPATRAGARLVRETRPAPDRGDPITSAVNGLLTLRPLDPGYRSPWRACARLITRTTPGGITVDLGSTAFAPGVHGLAALVAIQSLVWTATGAAGRQVPVTILVDGRAGYRAWGTIRLGRPLVRDLGVRAVVSIETPLESAALAPGLVRLTGIGAPADRRFSYVVRRGGRTVASGVAAGTTSPTPRWWFFDIGVTLPAGHYTASVAATGAGSRAGRWSDDRTFDVR
jgi:Sporulation and spore germination